MDHAVLVDIDVRLGAEILSYLDAEEVEVDVALWATFSDYFSPRLVIASEWLDSYSGSKRYGKFRELLPEKFSASDSPTLFLMNTSDPFIKELRERFKPFKDVRGKRLYAESFGGRYLEDGYMYRLR